MATFLPQNQFNSTSSDVDEAGASALAPTPDAPAADLLQAANSGAPQPRGEPAQTNATQPAGSPNISTLPTAATDLIHEIFAAKPKHFKLKHKLKRPPFAPDYEALEAAMHDPDAPRASETDPVWADEPPLFLKDA